MSSTIQSLGVSFSFTPSGVAGTNDWFEIAGVQLEAGSVATPFEFRPVGVELQLCQRYFLNWVGQPSATGYIIIGTGVSSTTTANANIFIPLPVAMRVTPTASFSGNVKFTDGSSDWNRTLSSVSTLYNCSSTSLWGIFGWDLGDVNLNPGRCVIMHTQNAATNVFRLSAEL